MFGQGHVSVLPWSGVPGWNVLHALRWDEPQATNRESAVTSGVCDDVIKESAQLRGGALRVPPCEVRAKCACGGQFDLIFFTH